MTEKKSFVLYNNYFNQIRFLDMTQRGELITAIFEFAIFGENKTQIAPITQLVFSMIRDGLERDLEAYKRRCDANRENGKKGGRPHKKRANSLTQKPKKADNDNENENDNGNDNDNGIDNGNGNGYGYGYGYGNGNDSRVSSAFSAPPISDVASCGASCALSEQKNKG